MFQLRGLRVVIEGKFADHPSAEEVVLNDARKRVKSGLAHIATAAISLTSYERHRSQRFLEILERSKLRYRIVSEASESDEWFEGTPTSLTDALRRAQETLAKDDIVVQRPKGLKTALNPPAPKYSHHPGIRPPVIGAMAPQVDL